MLAIYITINTNKGLDKKINVFALERRKNYIKIELPLSVLVTTIFCSICSCLLYTSTILYKLLSLLLS